MKFSKDALAINFILEDTSHLFDGNLSSGGLMDGTTDCAITTLTEKLNTLIVSSNLPVGKSIQIEALSFH